MGREINLEVKYGEAGSVINNSLLQEGNRWGDTFWGVDLRTGKGENKLGKILMRVRKELK